MKINNAIAPVERGFRALARLPHQIMAGLGLVVLIGTVVSSALLRDKDLAVAIAISGTFVGTALLSVFVPKVTGATKGEEVRRALTVSERERRVRELEARREDAERKLVEAEREIARLEGMRIDVETFRPILKLGLLEVETKITDYQHRVIGREEPQAWWRNGCRDAYVGVVQVPVKAHLGVDLSKVRVAQADKRLILSGLTMTTVTDTAEGAEWLLDEVRTEYLKGDKVVRFKGNAQDERAKAHSRAHELQVRTRLKEGQDFSVFESGLIRTAQQVLRVLLAPLGKEIVFEGGSSPDSQLLLEYLADHNQELGSRIASLKLSRPDPS